MLEPSATWITIAGATGFQKDIINGTYVKTTEVKNGKPVYAKVGNKNGCLFYTTADKWTVTDVTDKDTNATTGYACSPTTHLASPELETVAWRVMEKDSGDKAAFQDQTAVTVTAEVR